MEKKAVFIDKDGTLVKNVPYNIDPQLVAFEVGVIEGLKLLQHAGYLLVIISNQAGIAHGYFSRSEFEQSREYIISELQKQGIKLNGFYYCPHHPEATIAAFRESCNCRKPAPGMILQASHDLKINPAGSWMIGDILDDVQAGNRAGCKSILIDNGNETEWILTDDRKPNKHVRSFNEAVTVILENTSKIKSDYE